MAHSVRRIIIIIRRTFTFTVSKITVILYLEETERRQEDMGRFVNPDNSAFQVVFQLGYLILRKSAGMVIIMLINQV